ncbi:MAG: hypothetical protein ACLGP3_03510, partial [Acidobacteriota bacterium]
SQGRGLMPAEVRKYRAELWQAIREERHVGWVKPVGGAASARSRYEELIGRSPAEAVARAWDDTYGAAVRLLGSRVTLTCPPDAVPADTLAALLQQGVQIDQRHGRMLEHLVHAHLRIAGGDAPDEPAARIFCQAAEELLNYFATK